jgi:hypothetical protein
MAAVETHFALMGNTRAHRTFLLHAFGVPSESMSPFDVELSTVAVAPLIWRCQ